MPEDLEKKPVDSYDVIREVDKVTIRVDLENFAYTPSIEDDPICMSRTIEKLAEVKGATNIIFIQKRDYEYDYNQTRLLVEIAQVYKQISKMPEIRGYYALGGTEICSRCLPNWHAEINELLIRMLKRDPVGAYVELRRAYRREKIKKEHLADPRCGPCEDRYMAILNKVILMLDKTKLVQMAKPYLAGYRVGDREVYRRIFTPTIKPDFMFTKLMSSYPPEGEELASYTVGNTDVAIFGFDESVKYLYHIMPPEFKLEEDEYELLDLARRIMAEHKPKRSEFVDPKRMRDVFYNVGRDLIEELVEYKKMTLRNKQMDELAQILVRYTVGFGLIEVLLQDEKIQDVNINSPLGQVPMFIVHADFDDCTTNVIPTRQEAESWASKLRMISGRPLDEANQILDTEIELPGATARVSAITNPLDPTGLAFSFRRHRDRPWTLPLFIKYKMINPMGAGLLSFMVDGTRTMLIAGTRSSGKSSFLTSLLVEIMRRYRILTIEDTLELPFESLKRLGYNIQQMLVAGAFARAGTAEMPAEDGIRSTLRLGDSSLIVGEVRSTEAKALFEAMRVGAAANVVAGTIHADSPYGLYDRLVNDIGVPKTSFKAADICIVANPVRSASSLQKQRRIIQITEVGKDWDEDPMREGAFVDLMKYDPNTDQLEITDKLRNGESEILKTVAANIKEFAGNWDALWQNIELRGKIKETLVDYAVKAKDMELLEAEFVIKCNDRFHRLQEAITAETGAPDSERIFFEWDNWVKREIKKYQMGKKEGT
ncbi:type II/IV secretion system ATPase subunit [Candidatus Woesearchaeota archaeon]|nr:type II/IV secretion system ATPase subunit [Candidatus Woesearchaeota archaeon]